jgi:CRISPR/Cas system-associated exonuclease Cas4 (RecB family)
VQIDADGVLHVCDYKTVKNKKYLKNDFFQLLTYALVLCIEDPTITKVRGSYILLRHGCEYITKEFDLKEIMETKEKFLKYAEQIHAEQLWRANPTPLCNFCDYLTSCEDGKKKYGPKDDVGSGDGFGEVKWI